MRFLKLILIAALVSPVTVLAQGAKIAVINVDTAVSESAAGKAAIAERQAFFDERNAELQATQVELTRLQTELQTRERVLPPAALAVLNRDIQDLTTKLTRDGEDAELALQAKQDELFMPVFEKVGLMLEAYAQDLGFAVIFDVSNPQTGIIYFDEVVDVTAFLVDMDRDFSGYNKVYREYFDDAPPARAFLGSGTLLFGARFEVTGIAVRG